jgi:hypothetical protein
VKALVVSENEETTNAAVAACRGLVVMAAVSCGLSTNCMPNISKGANNACARVRRSRRRERHSLSGTPRASVERPAIRLSRPPRATACSPAPVVTP